MGTKMHGLIRAATPAEYIAKVDADRRPDIQRIHDMIREEAPQLEPNMDHQMLGYGSYAYKYASGREGTWFRVGLANNARYISLYCCAATPAGYVAETFKPRLPKASIGKSCVRFKRLADLDEDVLRELIRATAAGTWGM